MSAHASSALKIQGWRNIGVNRDRMLSAYRQAKTTNTSKPVKVLQGNVAEEQTRDWLTRFLPTRFGVTAGYIVSAAYSEADALHHYDVIIYDAHNSPILWIEEGAGDRRARAIPVNNVLAVLEVKAALTRKSATEALKKLAELRPLIRTPASSSGAATLLPSAFWAACLFFELRNRDAVHVDILASLLPDDDLPGYCGGIVLAGEGRNDDDAGRIEIFPTAAPPRRRSSLLADCESRRKRWSGVGDVTASITWKDFAFNRFAFDTLARLTNTYRHDKSILIDGSS